MRLKIISIVVILFFLNSCFSSSTSGSIRLKFTKDNVDSELVKIKAIVDSMDHNMIKEKIANKFTDFKKQNIDNSVIRYTKYWTANSDDNEATIVIRVEMNCGMSEFELAEKVIEFYEEFIITELETNGYSPESDL
ncbi:hypothetical protein ACFLSE_01795 [Bacteroidota bacterium]